MNLEVKRRWLTALSTKSEVWLDGVQFCYGLEPATRTDGQKPRAIPEGTYDLTLRYSPRFRRIMPHVEAVPGFDGILIHWGNYAEDTEGCLLVGQQRGPQPDFIGASRKAFDALFQRLQEAEGPMHITYTV